MFERIVRAYETAPATGNRTDEMLRRTEYVLAVQMLEKMRGGVDAKEIR
jgi:hypothetical protein